LDRSSVEEAWLEPATELQGVRGSNREKKDREQWSHCEDRAALGNAISDGLYSQQSAFPVNRKNSLAL